MSQIDGKVNQRDLVGDCSLGLNDISIKLLKGESCPSTMTFRREGDVMVGKLNVVLEYREGAKGTLLKPSTPLKDLPSLLNSPKLEESNRSLADDTSTSSSSLLANIKSNKGSSNRSMLGNIKIDTNINTQSVFPTSPKVFNKDKGDAVYHLVLREAFIPSSSSSSKLLGDKRTFIQVRFCNINDISFLHAIDLALLQKDGNLKETFETFTKKYPQINGKSEISNSFTWNELLSIDLPLECKIEETLIRVVRKNIIFLSISHFPIF